MKLLKNYKNNLSVSSVLALTAALFVAPLLTTNIFEQSTLLAAEEEGRRAPPPARSSQTLSRRVSSRIVEVMEFRDLEDYASAVGILDELKEMYDEDRLNDKEAFTMWLFYATIAQTQEQYPLAIEYFREILKQRENLTPDQLEQALQSIGALQFVLEQYSEAIETYEDYNSIALEPNADIYLRLGTAHYQIEQFAEGIEPILRGMEIRRSNGEEIRENTFSLLRALYIGVDDFVSAKQVLKEMIVLFNNDADWNYLSGIEGQLENYDVQAYVYYVSNILGILDSESLLRSFAGHLYNYDNPYGAARIIEKGMDDGIIPEDEDNLSFLSQAFQAAREDNLAIPPLVKVAEMTGDSTYYNRLGIIYSTIGDFDASVDAFDKAIDAGDVDRIDQIYMRLARAYLELNRFDEAIESARKAGDDERSAKASSDWMRLLDNRKRIYEVQEANRELYAGYFL